MPDVAEAGDSGLAKWVPGVTLVRNYQRRWLRDDVVAGLILTALLVPQGMAYAELAGLPAVTGLYTTVTALFAYAIFGPSRILVLGPDSSLAPLIAAIVAPLVVGDTTAEAVALAAMLAIMAGAIEVAAGWLRLGAITDLLSMPIRVGYLNGIAVVVLVSQLPKLFGFSTDPDDFFSAVGDFVAGVANGETVAASLVLGLGAIAIMLAGRRVAPRVPWVLVAVVVSVAIVAGVGLVDEGVSVVGPLPSGFPELAIPSVAREDLLPLLAGALAVAVVSFADTAALSRSFSAKLGDSVDQNREAVGLGAANIAGGLFSGFPVSASTSRTVVADSIGSKSQLTGVVAGMAIIVLLVGADNLLADLPSSVLAAVVIVASFGLFDLETMRRLFRVRRSDFLALVIAMLGVILVGVLEGLAIAVGVSVAIFVWKRWRPYSATLGRVRGRKGYHDTDRHPDAYVMPGLVLFRFDSPLFFASAPYFEERLRAAIAAHPVPVRRVVVAAEPITDIDSTGAEILDEVLDDLEHRGIEFRFAELKGPVKDRLQAYGLYDRIGGEYFYPTLGAAVSAYAADTGIPSRPTDDEASG